MLCSLCPVGFDVGKNTKISMSLSRRNTKAYRDFLGQWGDPCGDLHESSFGCFLWVEHGLDTQRHLLSLLAPHKKTCAFPIILEDFWEVSKEFSRKKHLSEKFATGIGIC